MGSVVEPGPETKLAITTSSSDRVKLSNQPEIMAGAISAAHRAELIGEKTFGTGTVLREFGLPDGSALLLAVEEWLTPARQAIWHSGITPDIAVKLPANTTPLLPEEESSMTVSQLRDCKDNQLLRALKLLSPSSKLISSSTR